MIFRAGVMRILAVFLVLFAPVLAWADQGTVIAVEQPARVQSDEGLVTLALGDTVTGGDIVATGQGGSVQLLFPDETRVVVGPSSQLKVRDLLYRNNNTARRFRNVPAQDERSKFERQPQRWPSGELNSISP